MPQWTSAEFQECTRYGKLFVIKELKQYPTLVVQRIGWRKGKLVITENKPTLVAFKINQENIHPEKDDLIFISTDGFPALLKRTIENEQA